MAEDRVLSLALLGCMHLDVKLGDFCHGLEGFNGWLYMHIKQRPGLEHLLSKPTKAQARRRGEHNLAAALALLLYRRDGAPHMIMPQHLSWYVQRLKQARFYRDQQLKDERDCQQHRQSWIDYATRIHRLDS